MLCAGEGLKNHKDLEQASIPHKTAIALEHKLRKAEKNIAPEIKNKFDLFGTAHDPVHSMHREMK
jgi:hypothetical protein